jgi:hypothetical protein
MIEIGLVEGKILAPPTVLDPAAARQCASSAENIAATLPKAGTVGSERPCPRSTSRSRRTCKYWQSAAVAARTTTAAARCGLLRLRVLPGKGEDPVHPAEVVTVQRAEPCQDLVTVLGEQYPHCARRRVGCPFHESLLLRRFDQFDHAVMAKLERSASSRTATRSRPWRRTVSSTVLRPLARPPLPQPPDTTSPRHAERAVLCGPHACTPGNKGGELAAHAADDRSERSCRGWLISGQDAPRGASRRW